MIENVYLIFTTSVYKNNIKPSMAIWGRYTPFPDTPWHSHNKNYHYHFGVLPRDKPIDPNIGPFDNDTPREAPEKRPLRPSVIWRIDTWLFVHRHGVKIWLKAREFGVVLGGARDLCSSIGSIRSVYMEICKHRWSHRLQCNFSMLSMVWNYPTLKVWGCLNHT